MTWIKVIMYKNLLGQKILMIIARFGYYGRKNEKSQWIREGAGKTDGSDWGIYFNLKKFERNIKFKKVAEKEKII